jgi:hypothetical protein
MESYWMWLSSKGLISKINGASLLKKFDEICNKDKPSAEETRIRNLAYWFECQFEVPSTDERCAEYFQRLLSELEIYLK